MGVLLDEVLADAQRRGFLGPRPIAEHRAHAAAFLTALDGWDEGQAIDLGSGGGVPGLVLADALPGTRWVLLDAMVRRATFLADAIERLGLTDRVGVLGARAEAAAWDERWRTAADVVVARGFGAPAVTAECAAGLLREGGVLVVSEPPAGSEDRWPVGGLAALGLVRVASVPGPPAFVRLQRVGPLPAGVPRRVGIPAKRPLW